MAHAKQTDPNVFILPDLGEGVHEAELIKWRVSVGDTVEEYDILADMETDKAVVEVPSPRTGVIRQLHGEEGQILEVGNPLVTYEGADGAAEAPAESGKSKKGKKKEAAPEPAEREDSGTVVGQMSAHVAGMGHKGTALATPAVRRLARDLGVNLDAVAGSGIGGRVTKGDVEAAAQGGGAVRTASAEASPKAQGLESPGLRRTSSSPPPARPDVRRPLAPPPQAAPQPAYQPAPQPMPQPGYGYPQAPYAPPGYMLVPVPMMPPMYGGGGGIPPAPGYVPQTIRPIPDPAQQSGAAPGGEERVPFRGIRRTIAGRLRESIDTAVHFTVMDEADVTALDEHRRALAAQSGEKLSYLPFVAAAVCRVLTGRFGAMNARVEGNEVVQHGSVHLGIAADTDAGLMVPVIRDADRMSVVELGRAIASIAAAARDRSIPRDDLLGSTFTISNVGSHAGRFATPVINYPEVAILAVGAVYDGVVVRDGQPVVAKLMPLSLACDHRVVDGATAALGLAEIVRVLGEPGALG